MVYMVRANKADKFKARLDNIMEGGNGWWGVGTGAAVTFLRF